MLFSDLDLFSERPRLEENRDGETVSSQHCKLEREQWLGDPGNREQGREGLMSSPRTPVTRHNPGLKHDSLRKRCNAPSTARGLVHAPHGKARIPPTISAAHSRPGHLSVLDVTRQNAADFPPRPSRWQLHGGFNRSPLLIPNRLGNVYVLGVIRARSA